MTTNNSKLDASDAIHNTSRTARLLELMKKGDNAFNSRDFEGMNAVHHPDMIAHITGNTQPIYGRAAHAKLMKEMFLMFPDVHVYNDPYPIQFGSSDWITVIARITGTFTGEMILPEGKVIAHLEKHLIWSCAKPQSGKATNSSLFPHSGTL